MWAKPSVWPANSATIALIAELIFVLSVVASFPDPVKDLAGAIAVEDLDDMVATHRDAIDRTHGRGRDPDLGEILLPLFVDVHRLGGASFDIDDVARGFSIVFDSFDSDDLGRTTLVQR